MIDEINSVHAVGYSADDVRIKIDPVVPTDEKEDAEIKKLDAETDREKVGALLDAAEVIGGEALMKETCKVLKIDYDEAVKAQGKPMETELMRGILLDGQETEGSTA